MSGLSNELWSRRRFLRRLSQSVGALALVSGIPAIGRAAEMAHDRSSLIVRLSRPQDLETPVEYLDSSITPNSVFFVRSHFGPPAIIEEQWKLEIGGLVDSSRSLTLEDLRKFEIVDLPATLQCSGNGRAFFHPSVPGVQWQRGAVGNALWRGVRLRDVVKSISIKSGARHMQMRGYDSAPMPTTPSFTRSIPIERALDPSTLLAFEMNGEPLPVLHGGPLRMVVPGWAGDHWYKWLRRIDFQEHEAEGFYMQTAYRMPRQPVPSKGIASLPEVPVTVNPVKSLIAHPSEGSVMPPGDHLVSGVAFTGVGHMVNVEVSLDGGRSWDRAELEGKESEGTWQLWRYRWRASTKGPYIVAARATDSSGRVQPQATPWNHGGYLWNGIDLVHCEIA